MEAWITGLLAYFALPEVGLPTVFAVALLSATLLPLGSEFALFGLLKVQPDLLWPAILVATAGNTLGGAISWWMGYGAERAFERVSGRQPAEQRALGWLRRFGPPACLLSWVPAVGDPLCALAGWLKMPFWPCVAWMGLGKFARYLLLTTTLLWAFPGQLGA